jgi:hypothetical protein
MIATVTSGHSLEKLTAEDFRGHQGTRFRLAKPRAGGSAADSVEAELADVREYPESAMGTFRHPFSVVFHGPLEPVMPQGIYRVEHEHFGSAELLLVPIGPNEVAPGENPTAMRYEAVFG